MHEWTNECRCYHPISWMRKLRLMETLPSLIGLCGCLLTAPVCPLLCSRRLAAERDSGKGQASSQESSPSLEPQEHLTFHRDPAPGTELRAWWAWCHLVPHSHPLLISEKETEAQSTERLGWSHGKVGLQTEGHATTAGLPSAGTLMTCGPVTDSVGHRIASELKWSQKS